jgi:hypothetical protein
LEGLMISSMYSAGLASSGQGGAPLRSKYLRRVWDCSPRSGDVSQIIRGRMRGLLLTTKVNCLSAGGEE